MAPNLTVNLNIDPVRNASGVLCRAINGAHLRFVKILVPEISESVVLDHNAEGQEIT
jgi:hypothetical protein